MVQSNKTVVAVVGPTAVGKTALGICLANHFNTEILSADSRQCFKELNIGVVRPTQSELQASPHHFIASHSIHNDFAAADYESYALEIAEKVFVQNDRLVLVGGTGLYVRAFLSGLDKIPEVDPVIRAQVIQQYAFSGIEGLQSELTRLDPLFSTEGEMQNPQRMMRALEVVLATGKSILSYQTGSATPRPFKVRWVGLQLPREILVDRINKRVDAMMAAGWLEEARQLLPYRHMNALQTVGYKELFDHLAGIYSLSEAVERIKVSTRQYAKRQMTWFRSIPDMNWYDPSDLDGILKDVES